jgi:hypothetical protein
MPAPTALINGVAIALELPLQARFLGEIEYNLNLVELSAGPDIFVSIQQLIDQVQSIELAQSSGAAKGTGLLKRADDVEWDTTRSDSTPLGRLSSLRRKLARLLLLDHLLEAGGGNNTMKILS